MDQTCPHLFYQPLLRFLVLLMVPLRSRRDGPSFIPCTDQRVPRSVGTTRAVIHRFRKSRQDHQWRRGSHHFQDYQCWTDRQYFLCQDGFTNSYAAEGHSLTQEVSSLTARVCKIERIAASASSVSRLSKILAFTRTGRWLYSRRVSVAQGHLTTAGTQDADLILSQTQIMKMPEVPFYCSSRVNNSMLACLLGSLTEHATPNMPVRIHWKTGSTFARLVLKLRAKCQEIVARFNDDGRPCTVDSPFCNTNATLLVRQSKHQKTEKSENILHHSGEFWLQNYKIFSPERIGILLTDLPCCVLQCPHLWIFLVLEKAELPRFICRFLRSKFVDSYTVVEFAGRGGHFFMARGVDKAALRAAFSSRRHSTPFFDGYMIRSSQETLPSLASSSPLRAHMPMIL